MFPAQFAPPADAFAARSTTTPTATESIDAAEPDVERLWSRDYLRLALKDAGHVLSAPARWQRAEWAKFGFATAGVVVIAAFLDEPIRDAVDGDPANAEHGLLGAIEPFGQKHYTLPVLAGFYVAGAALDDNTAKAVALDGLVAMLIANTLVTDNLKRLIGRSRPEEERGADHFRPRRGDHSFPSGHTTHAFAVASVIAEHYESRWVRGLSYGMAGLVAAARIKHDQHWTSDVVAGALIGSFVGREVVVFNRGERAARGKSAPTLGSDGQMLTMSWSY